MADNGVIGRGGTLPSHLPDDLKHFKTVTLGKPVLRAGGTLHSIGTPLPGRRNLVLPRGTLALAEGVEAVASIEAARALVPGASELCVIGGAAVYEQSLPVAARLYLTRVHGDVTGDGYFPPWDVAGSRAAERL